MLKRVDEVAESTTGFAYENREGYLDRVILDGEYVTLDDERTSYEFRIYYTDIPNMVKALLAAQALYETTSFTKD